VVETDFRCVDAITVNPALDLGYAVLRHTLLIIPAVSIHSAFRLGHAVVFHTFVAILAVSIHSAFRLGHAVLCHTFVAILAVSIDVALWGDENTEILLASLSFFAVFVDNTFWIACLTRRGHERLWICVWVTDPTSIFWIWRARDETPVIDQAVSTR